MEVKPAQRIIEEQFSGHAEAQMEGIIDFGDMRDTRVAVSRRPENAADLQNIAARIGKIVADACAVLDAFRRGMAQKARAKSSVMSTVAHKLDSAHTSAGADFDVIEVTADSPVSFRREELLAIYCFDLNRCDVRGAADWISRAKENNRVLPQIVVIGPEHGLSNSDYKFVAREIAPLAVYFPRPANAKSFEDILKVVREETAKVMAPQRLAI